MEHFSFINQASNSEFSPFCHYKSLCIYRLSIKSLGIWSREALVVVLVSVRNYLVPGGTLFSDHVLKGRIEELACRELAAIVAQVLLSCSCIIVQFWNLKEGVNCLVWKEKGGRGLLVKYQCKRVCRIRKEHNLHLTICYPTPSPHPEAIIFLNSVFNSFAFFSVEFYLICNILYVIQWKYSIFSLFLTW